MSTAVNAANNSERTQSDLYSLRLRLLALRRLFVFWLPGSKLARCVRGVSFCEAFVLLSLLVLNHPIVATYPQLQQLVCVYTHLDIYLRCLLTSHRRIERTKLTPTPTNTYTTSTERISNRISTCSGDLVNYLEISKYPPHH